MQQQHLKKILWEIQKKQTWIAEKQVMWNTKYSPTNKISEHGNDKSYSFTA